MERLEICLAASVLAVGIRDSAAQQDWLWLVLMLVGQLCLVVWAYQADREALRVAQQGDEQCKRKQCIKAVNE